MADISPGGDRVFFIDPDLAGLSTMIGDMAAMNLQLLQVFADDAVPDAKLSTVGKTRNQPSNKFRD